MKNVDKEELKKLNKIAELQNEAIRLCLDGVITQEEIPRYHHQYLREREFARMLK